MTLKAISETYNHCHNILELADILPNASSQQVKRNVIITNRNDKYELTDELPNDELPKNLRKSQNSME